MLSKLASHWRKAFRPTAEIRIVDDFSCEVVNAVDLMDFQCLRNATGVGARKLIVSACIVVRNHRANAT